MIELKKINQPIFVTSLMLLICLCMCLFVPVVAARDAFAPSWLKEGVYAKYENSPSASAAKVGVVTVFDVMDPQFAGTNYLLRHSFDSLYVSNHNIMWRCVNVNDTIAKLEVTFDYVGETLYYWDGPEQVSVSLGGEDFQRIGEVYVDLYTRAVYNVEGVFLGTTHLWAPANPNIEQEIVVWQEDPEIITISVTIPEPGYANTVQGVQDIFQLRDIITIKGQQQSIVITYDLDTGLGVGGLFTWDPIFAVVGLSNGGFARFSDTNINLGSERSAITWIQILQYSLIPIAIILLVTALVIKRRKKMLNP